MARWSGARFVFAALLRRRGVGRETRVGLALERSVDFVVAVLAVIKAGGAYVPLDIDYPPERLAFLMRDAGLALLLTQSHVAPRLPIPDGVPCIALDALDDAGPRRRRGASGRRA